MYINYNKYWRQRGISPFYYNFFGHTNHPLTRDHRTAWDFRPYGFGIAEWPWCYNLQISFRWFYMMINYDPKLPKGMKRWWVTWSESPLGKELRLKNRI